MIQDIGKIRVLVVNDSLIIREYLCDIIRSSEKLELSGTARDGADALRKLQQVRPDVILLDLEMPNMDGITLIEHVMSESKRIPIIVVSSYGDIHSIDDGNDYQNDTSSIIFDCLNAGAVDFVSLAPGMHKEESRIGNSEDVRHELISRIETASQANITKLRPIATSKNWKKRTLSNSDSNSNIYCSSYNEKPIVIIGSSAGGPRVVAQILSKLPGDLWAGVLIVQHMPPTFTAGFARHLDSISTLNVKEASEGDVLSPGLAFVAPGDYHVLVDRAGVLHLDKSARRHGVRPCINMSMVSASNAFGKKVLGVVLSGMGDELHPFADDFGRHIIANRSRSDAFSQSPALTAARALLVEHEPTHHAFNRR